MSLDRDELAARVLVALVARDYPSADTARFAVNMADALLARLRPEAVAPAASPAPYVPKVGDVVHGLYGDDTLARITYVALNGKTGRASGFGRNQIPDSFVAFTDDTRPATSSERAAAGLPVDESATKPVDREGLVAAMNKAARLWVESADKRSLAECHADAAIAFMAKGPAFDRAEFNEAQEREAALDAYRAGTDGCIDPEGTKYPACRDSFRNGWIARARVAAKGGVA